ncbi:MAG: ABC transporter transmembrane domain-containing protein, partial [Bacillales bacterium]|nr:ABC transporter transmembrane domain-containing protein [Bacillales bacterium]
MPKNMKKPSPRIPKGTFRRLMKDIFSFFPLSWIVVFVCLALVVCANASASLFLTQITKFTIEGVENGWESVKKGMLNLLFVMIAVRGSGVIASTIQNLLMARITQGSLLKIRIKMFNAMEKLPIRYFDSHNSGDIMSYYTNDTDSLRMLISQCITALVQSVIMLIILLAIMLSTSIWLSLIIFLGIVVMFNVTKKVTGNAGQGFIAQQKNIARVEGFVEEMMHGQKVV